MINCGGSPLKSSFKSVLMDVSDSGFNPPILIVSLGIFGMLFVTSSDSKLLTLSSVLSFDLSIELLPLDSISSPSKPDTGDSVLGSDTGEMVQ